MVESIITGAVYLTVSTLIGSIFYRIRRMENEIAEKVAKKEVRELIADKLESHTILLEDVRQDVEKLVDKLDRFLFAGPRD